MKYSEISKLITPLVLAISLPVAAHAWNGQELPFKTDQLESFSECNYLPWETDHETVKEKFNKELVVDAYNRLALDADESALVYWAEDYIQHNPQIDNGRESVKALFIDNRPANLEWEIANAFAEGDFVVTYSRGLGFGPLPLLAIDIFKVIDGQIVEHWDTLQTEVTAEDSVNGNPMYPIERDACTEATGNELQNRNIAVKVLTSMFAKLDASVLDEYFSEDYIQHNPTMANGIEPVRQWIESQPAGTDLGYQVGFAVAEGDYVILQSRFSNLSATPMIVIDIYRFEDGKIKEHWDLMQEEVNIMDSVNGNPMFPAF